MVEDDDLHIPTLKLVIKHRP